ncbi:hypothetical protein [Limnohabitans sp. MMS-10A-178]|uniref:hypothetical protein n=1 Tax=Limnohabitans sp. MMS-10A-178 TaxID=1835767 RepID=UPI000D34271D|nr:hypothetical protein [Limnohabitans sp. MMS-10A-178]PUE17329.1 hypothetical protein B9Z32_07410 [Limnohabitans sp. MMS-10A-178]
MLLGAWWIWVVALALYIVFRLWYDNWRGPLSPQEVNDFMNQVSDLKMSEYSDPKDLRAFLEADDGKEFVMVNLVRVHTGELAHPHTGKPTKGIDLLREYGNSFVKVLVRHGGHPVLVMRKVGGYIDSWNIPPDPGWHVAGSMRYRSRRDMMKLALDPSVRDVHILKTAATATTFSFPSQVVLGLAIRPRVWVALLLTLSAALVHLASLIALIPQ